MNLTSHVTHPHGNASSAAVALLGAEHPLSRTLERIDAAGYQLLVAVGLLMGACVPLVTGGPGTLPVAVGAALGVLGLAGRLCILLDDRRRCVLDLLADGRSDVPLPLVEHAAGRLCSEHHRRQLIAAVDSVLDPRLRPFQIVTYPWRFVHGDLVSSARSELRAIARDLEERDVSVRGIALLEQLMFDGISPLHGEDPRAARDALRRVRYRLEARSHR